MLFLNRELLGFLQRFFLEAGYFLFQNVDLVLAIKDLLPRAILFLNCLLRFLEGLFCPSINNLLPHSVFLLQISSILLLDVLHSRFKRPYDLLQTELLILGLVTQAIRQLGQLGFFGHLGLD